MNNTRHIHINDYNYLLPEERIAKHPVSQRDLSQLLVYNGGKILHTDFRHITDWIPAGSLMVFNNTTVIQARLHFHKTTGALIEIFCLEPHLPADYERIFQEKQECQWKCLVGNRKKWKEGPLQRQLDWNGKTITLSAEMTEKEGESDIIRFSWDNEDATFTDILSLAGELPIPPYLNRQTEESDRTNYQTVYSKIDGSVAAPTAGLHFTDTVLKDLDNKGVERNEITLHVGAGTFKPVKAEEMAGHEMHAEYIHVSLSSIEALIRHQGKCTCVGTTSVRTIESLYYIGVNIIQHPDTTEDQLGVSQWQPYDCSSQVSALDALKAIRSYLITHHLDALHTTTRIIIAPGYTYHYVQRIITNFHMPKSTLLLLVSAFVGNDWRRIYNYALQHDFRFLSYGDSSILIPHSND